MFPTRRVNLSIGGILGGLAGAFLAFIFLSQHRLNPRFITGLVLAGAVFGEAVRYVLGELWWKWKLFRPGTRLGSDEKTSTPWEELSSKKSG